LIASTLMSVSSFWMLTGGLGALQEASDPAASAIRQHLVMALMTPAWRLRIS
jgi:hypothetical protein